MNEKKRPPLLKTVFALAFVALLFLIFLIAAEYYHFSALQKKYNDTRSGNSYTYHCAFITDDSDSTFWDSVYRGAAEQGLASGIWVEYFGRDLYTSHTTDELLEMAIAANTDAILIEATGRTSTRQLIDDAMQKGIAVSTIYKDDMNSRRFSFTGINNFRMGYQYGVQTQKHTSGPLGSVTVLLDGEEITPEQRLLVSGIGQALEELGQEVRVETMVMDSRNAFEVEEKVRDFMRKTEHARGSAAVQAADVIICTDLVQTQFVSQTAVDLNYVDDFTIIGSSENRAVLEALKSGVIAVNLVIDTEQMGRKAVSNLEEYLTLGHTSDYISIDISTMGRQDAVQHLAALDAETEAENE